MKKRLKTYDVKISDSLFNPEDRDQLKVRKAHYRKGKSGRNLYKVYLYLEGNDVPFIKKATYTLHQSFNNRVRVIERRPQNPYCKLVLWTWGLFYVKIELEDINGQRLELNHFLTYGEQIKKGEINWEVQF
ncbi:hypothetical protein TPENAI_60393 [Tenacibaculum litopenaei]|uniref:pYEATS domain-containing protein n=1 Tax=Tenacibaculum litopenaei TaxID=396016 RepID=UPI003894F279